MRIGFIGTGNFAQQHAEILQSLGKKITACYGSNVAKTKYFAEKFNCIIFNNPEEFVSKEYIDALYLVIPPYAYNGKIESAAIANNIPFFCEKPLGLNLKVCEQIAKEIKDTDLITSSGYLLRYEKLFTQIKEILDRNIISSVRISSYSYMPQVHWWRRQAKSGGMMVESGSHYIDLLRYLFGDINGVSAVSAHGIAAKQFPDCDIADSMESILTFTNGMIGSIGMTHLLNNIKARQDKLEIHGQDFAMHIDLYQLRYGGSAVAIYKEHGCDEWQRIENISSKKELLLKENLAFLQATTDKDNIFIKSDYLDAVKTLKVVLSVNESARLGRFMAI